ncbi:MAG: EamA family transporter [Bacilli bacterium]|nr:EamA family transporter [Bacilli bacterium]
MLLIYIVILAGICGAIGQYLDKHLVNKGISRKDYFYYMCLSMIPFSIIMVIVEYFTNQLKFQLNFIPLILLVIAMFLRYKKQHTIVGCLKYLNPYEDSAYLTLGIIIAFVIDVILGIENISIFSILSILLTIIGVFAISNSKLKIKNLQKDLLVRITTSLLMSYVTHYMLQYWSNAVFILIMNLLLTIIFSKDYNFKYHKKQKNIIKWVFAQQLFGFCSLYMSNYLASNSVTLSSYVRPTSIIVVVIIAMFFKDKERKPNVKQIIGILLVILGICLINNF